MLNNCSLSNYKINQVIYSSKNSLVYRGIRIKDNLRVIIKTLNDDAPLIDKIMSFEREYTIGKKLNGIEGVVKIIELVNYGANLAIIMEDVNGISLKDFFKEKNINDNCRELFIDIAIQLSKFLSEIHLQDIIHKAINPSNILISKKNDSSELSVKFIDFSYASELSREHPSITTANYSENLLPYISPEQTGRMNRDIDYRSDYYSLGVTFYELLSGILPFNAKDRIGLIHSHLAETAQIPELQQDSQIPLMIWQIIFKLMAKNAEDRYQSMYGLQRDLLKVLENKELENVGQNKYFVLGSDDRSQRFYIPQKLYGREKELDKLMNSYNKMLEGENRLFLVGGYSGIGKTSLIKELQREVAKKNGYIIEGKFDQFKKNIPYSALIQAIKSFVSQLMVESEEMLALAKDKIKNTLESNCAVITEIIPEFEKIVGKYPPLETLTPVERNNRFFNTFTNLIKIIANKDHPLIIFIDDLHWSDIPSFNLLERLVVSTEIKYCMFVGAYRDNEVNLGHPLS
ncbi:MAG: AAA family ATPase, partial [Oligoflexia bacterium]|nr:AAA family ATPase [Oligoflexia bacterium]